MNDTVKTALSGYTDFIISLGGIVQIYLFGSQINDKQHLDSDIDLLVVVDDNLDAIKMAYKINRGILKRNIPLDVLVNRKSEFLGAATENTIQRAIKNEGLLVYDAQ